MEIEGLGIAITRSDLRRRRAPGRGRLGVEHCHELPRRWPRRPERSFGDVSLSCPDGAPGVVFGPEAPLGACATSQWEQSVLGGATGVGTTPTRWRAGSVSTVSQCGSPQLVTTTSRDGLLLDRSRLAALLLTRDGLLYVGRSRGSTARPSGRFTRLGQIMTLTADGVLVAVRGEPL